MSSRPRHSRHGFTLVEAITSIVIIAVVMGLSSRIISAAMDSYTASSARAALVQECSAAFERIAAELRHLPARTGAGGLTVPDITQVTPSSITWTGGGTLALTGSDLTLRPASEAAETLLQDATALSLRAYNADSTALATSLSGVACEPIRLFEISITASRAGITETLRSRIYLRNTAEGVSP